MAVSVAITNLTPVQLEQVFVTNSKLQEELRTDNHIAQTIYVNEILDAFNDSLFGHSISSYGDNYIMANPSKLDLFIKNARKVHTDYPLFSQQGAALIDRAEAKLNELHEKAEHYKHISFSATVGCINTYIQTSAELDCIVKDIESEITERLTSYLLESNHRDKLIEYLVTYYANEHIPNAYIILDENTATDYVLHETVTKVYN